MPLDPSSATILGLSVGTGLAAGRVLLGKLLGPALDAVGEGAAADLIAWKNRRIERAEDLLNNADKFLKSAGAEAHPVPGRVLWPILEKGSLEEEDPLRTTWARLLASAAAAPDGPGAMPAFPQILSELSPTEARMLGEWFSGIKRDPSWPYSEHHLWPRDYSDTRKPDEREAALIAVDNLVRLQIVQRVSVVKNREMEDAVRDIIQIGRSRRSLRLEEDSQEGLRFTALGWAFVTACAGLPPTAP